MVEVKITNGAGRGMRSVVQRVDSARVSIDSNLSASVGKGLLVFLGVEKGDGEADAEYLLEKIISLRVFEDDAGKMNRSLVEIAGEMLVVSQFTLLGDTAKGRRPSFVRAEEPARARALYEFFLKRAAGRVRRLATGEFQAMMKVELINDGPVTLLMDSRRHYEEVCS